MIFNLKVFERLLFPIHQNVYEQIERQLYELDDRHPGKLDEIKESFKDAYATHTQNTVWRPGHVDEVKYPSINIAVSYDPREDYRIRDLKKVAEPIVSVDYDEKSANSHPGNHLVLGYRRRGADHSYIVPMELLLGYNAKEVLKEESYQLYLHSLIPRDIRDNFYQKLMNETAQDPLPRRLEGNAYSGHMLQYIGITKRTWQKRFREHLKASQKGSHLLFHRALRGDFTEVGVFEHVVERAGLTQSQALELEETEVENRTLYPIHPRGLNMIPGGRAGLAFINLWAKRTGFKLKNQVNADNIESVLDDLQTFNLRSNEKMLPGTKTNAELARLWAEDLNFRIKVMTNRKDRLTLEQIIYARIWNASGWSIDKIHQNLLKMSDRKISKMQVQRLLDGKTYTSIPDLIL